jgi:hypothetical protein
MADKQSSIFDFELYHYVEPLRGFDLEEWISPMEAEALLVGRHAETPMPARQYLAWRASREMLQTVATEIIERYPAGACRYRNIPLKDEWNFPGWDEAHAVLWCCGRMQRASGHGDGLVTEYRGIAFERSAIEAVAEMFAPDHPSRAVKPLLNDHAQVRPPRRRGRALKYDRDSFISEAIRQLEHQGGFTTGEFIKADLYAAMMAWCEKQRWTEIPDRTWIYDRIEEAETAYLSANSVK